MNTNSKQKTASKTLFDQQREKKRAAQVVRRPVVGGFESETDNQRERLRGLEKAERKEVPQKARLEQRKEFTVFSFVEYKERKKVSEKIKQVRKELMLAIAEMKKLGTSLPEVERVAYEQIPDPGIYHLNFFERIIAMLKVLRKNITQSKSWLDTVFARKGKKRYWSRAKRGGSKFTMSHERRLATQAG
jgi:hypothetical protein